MTLLILKLHAYHTANALCKSECRSTFMPCYRSGTSHRTLSHLISARQVRLRTKAATASINLHDTYFIC